MRSKRVKMSWIVIFAMAINAGIRNIQASLNQSETSVQLAFIVPEDTSYLFCRDRVQPAIEIAQDRISRDQLLPGVDFNVRYSDSKCDSVQAPLAAFNFFHEHQADVFMGPVCDYSLAPVARYSPYWNIPVITPGGMAHDFGANKTAPNAEYAMLTRVGWSFDTLSEFTASIISHYDWRSIKLLYNSTGHSDVTHNFCYLFMNALISHLRDVSTLDFDVAMFNNQEHLPHEIPRKLTIDVARYAGKYRVN